jgi:uncharacterized protein (UPF0276 family)
MGERASHPATVAAAIGIGLRAPHLGELIARRPAIGWLEVHAENYFSGGPGLARLEAIRCDYPLSVHGVGLSLGSADGVDREHLQRLTALVRRVQPFIVSEHLSWSTAGGAHLNDLLPLPYTEETLDLVARNVAIAQNALGTRLLVENPSAYLRFRHSTIAEQDFLAELVRRTGCGLLCDVNNIFVSGSNLGLDPDGYLAALPGAAVGEIHLAGHARVLRGGESLLIDDHGAPISPPVWELYRRAVARFGLVPSLVEWDTNLPALDVLLGEARTAERAALAALDADARAA